MIFAFIIDPLDSLKAYKDSSIAMMRAAHDRGHQVWVIQQPALRWSNGWRNGNGVAQGPRGVVAEAIRLEVSNDDHDWYREIAHDTLPLTHFDGIVMRKDPPYDIEFVTTTWLLDCAVRDGAKVFNAPQALREHSEKLAIAEFPEFTVPTLVSRDMAALNRFIDDESNVVLKPLDGMGGSSIFRVHRHDPNRNVIVETLAQFGARTVMAQRYIPEISEGDKRILLVDGRPMPYSLARIPKAGESRGNLAAGGTGVARELSTRDREIAEKLGPILAARGLLLVGLDVIGDFLTEINVTSPTCMVEIRAQTGFDVAVAFVVALEKQCA